MSVTLESPAKNGCTDRDAVWVGTRVDPRNHVLYGSPDPPWEGAILRGKGAPHCKIQGLSAVICAKTAEPIEMPFGLWARMTRRNHVLDGDPAARRDVAMATNFGTNIDINWPFVDDSDKAIGYRAGLSGRHTECRYCRYPAPKARCHSNHFLAFGGL